MEFLLPVLDLIVKTIQGIAAANSQQSQKDKHKIGKKLAQIVVALDDILERAATLISQIELLAERHSISDEELSNLKSAIKQQSEAVRKLAREVSSAERDTEDKYKWFERARTVIAIWGNEAVTLPYLLGDKEEALTVLREFAERAYIVSPDGGLVVRHYLHTTPAKPPFEYYTASDEERAKRGWLIYSDLHLTGRTKSRQYFSKLRRQLKKLKNARDALARMLRTNFEVQDIT
jgi:hypothetical protein